MNETQTAAQLLAKRFPFKPTAGQSQFFDQIGAFITREEYEHYRDCFLLRGYAGTGKTTLVGTLIKVLPRFGYKSVLLAPTGRAAKVMTNYAKKPAQTIHRKIYRQVADPGSGVLAFQRQKNYHEDTLFIVDEASMISDEAEFGGKGLLTDLIDFVFESPGNKLMLVGDTAQLPPIGQELSPALDRGFLASSFDMSVYEQELTEVMRQDEESGILYNATNLRMLLDGSPSPTPKAVGFDALLSDKPVSSGSESPAIRLVVQPFNDIYKMPLTKLEDGIRYAYDKYGRENTAIICRSNKTAVQYNQFVRRMIDQCEEELDAGDMLMIARNNYTILDEDSPAGFLANGEFVEVQKIRNKEEMHGFRFATVTLRMVDYDDQPDFEAKIILDTLYSPSPSLTSDQYKGLYESVMKDYFYIKSKKERTEAIRRDPYLNALQVKFAYALTCHKAQGGQWSAIFIDQGFLPDGQVNDEFVRWLYTGLTRATDEAFLMNFSPQFFT
ncbi:MULTISPECIES: AAA family ATPase [unclassified Spirosoma]|uniref:ATP-dependent DNA helicase n=1 Tax=unclassified Spirosoma TaxID=2621999 RepID=UPI00095CB01A|nr:MULTISPECIES: AAA family ATPase [unclassified Spirosoma]MBN8825211.1 AAA family ATPase [Spirosoma sp.]OJW75299.1 MAG: ATP-dependent endonuclease [Spirosoma sp. 48-14]